MKVEVRSDKPISDAVLNAVVTDVEAALSRHADRLTRVEVHLKNIGAEATTKPLECRIEARPRRQDPVAVSHSAATRHELVDGAARKLNRLLESMFGRQDSTKGGPSASGLPT